MSSLFDSIMELPVFDTHTHLNNPDVPIPARNFWNIGHYFWFLDDQISRGWLIRDDALYVAREWLHDAAARRYT